MIVGVMSDTHRNGTLMHMALDAMVAKQGVERVLHLGDDFEDAQQLEGSGTPTIAVPGLWCREYGDPSHPKARLEELDGWRVAMAHADKDLAHLIARAHIVLTGHTHRASLAMENGRLRLNPGHLKGGASRGQEPSYASLALEPDAVTASIHRLDGETMRLERFERSAFAAEG
jgi:putative phosphoesterase